ncbi:hypothetical protein Y032_0152g2883 [Ancylostoma ceylanicum]|uniref:Reverse transcriptase domain-containing protein n=1 Tax=Ancylostoma ceylanicum TaxID=53326 RepID=A0A016T0L8_9BILA|nr:hypothetical protein Y032_0152g2883 [Ancylostoma ceylanicum]
MGADSLRPPEESGASTSRHIGTFCITVGIHQGAALSPLLFILVMDAVTRDVQKPAPWKLLYARDVVIGSEDKCELERQTQAWSDRLAQFGLLLNVTKTEYLTTDVNQIGTISVGGTNLLRTEAFKYLESTVSSDGCLSHEVTARINATWLKWRSLTGVLCDKNIPDRLKSKIHRTVIQLVALYATECWPATKKK